MELLLLIVIIGITLNYATLLSFFSLRWFRYHRKKSVKEISSYSDNISILLPFRNEAAALPLILKHFGNQELSGLECEVLLINDGSTDDSVDIIEAFIGLSHPNIKFRLLHCPTGKSGKAEALHFGVQQARYSQILTTDADCRLPENWISSMARYWNKDEKALLIGMVVPEKAKSILQEFFALEFLSLTGSGAGAALMNRPFICNGANMGFSRELWNAYFSNSRNSSIAHGDDVFLLHHALKAKNTHVVFVRDKESFVSTSLPIDVKSFLRQRIRWGGKAAAYSHFFSVFVSLSVLAINALICLLFAAAIFVPGIWKWWLLIMAAKLAADGLLIWLSCKAVERLPLLRLFLPFSIVYPFYLFTTALASLFVKVKWKN